MNIKKTLKGIVLAASMALPGIAKAGTHKAELLLQYGPTSQTVSNDADKTWSEGHWGLDAKVNAKGHDDSMAYEVKLSNQFQNPRTGGAAIPLRSYAADFVLGPSTQSEDNKRLQLLFGLGGEGSRIRTSDVTGAYGNLVLFGLDDVLVKDSRGHMIGKVVYAFPRAELSVTTKAGLGRSEEEHHNFTNTRDYNVVSIEAASAIKLNPGQNKDRSRFSQELRPSIKIETATGGKNYTAVKNQVSYITSIGKPLFLPGDDMALIVTGFHSYVPQGARQVDLARNGNVQSEYGGNVGLVLRGNLAPQRKKR